MTFRNYRPADESAVRALLSSNIGTFFSPNEVEEIEELLAYMAGVAEGRSTAEEEAVFWVGEVEGQIVASGGLESIDGAAFLCWGSVHAEHQGKGYGDLLLKHRIDFVRQAWPHVGSIFSDTAPKTEGFYERHGFVAKHRQTGYWGGDIELVVMELSLDGLERFPLRLRPDGSVGFRLANPD